MTTAYRHAPAPGSFRTKCQHWGVVYVFEPAEQPAPPATPPPNNTPAPNP